MVSMRMNVLRLGLQIFGSRVDPQPHQYGAPWWIRTTDPQLRRLLLYPTELRAPARQFAVASVPPYKTERRQDTSTAADPLCQFPPITPPTSSPPHHDRPTATKGLPGMSLLPLHALEGLIHQYGYSAIFLCIMLESIGLPLPGESLMIAAALYAAHTHHLNIFILVPLAAAGAICGDQIGYGIGRWIGYRVLARWGRKVGMTERATGTRPLSVPQIWRQASCSSAASLRSCEHARQSSRARTGCPGIPSCCGMRLGGIGWTALYGFGAYVLGDAAKHIRGPVGIGLAVIGGVALLAAVIFINRNESRLIADARRQMTQT